MANNLIVRIFGEIYSKYPDDFSQLFDLFHPVFTQMKS